MSALTNDKSACGLCGCGVLVRTKSVPVAELAPYWENLNYEMSLEHPNLPLHFDVLTCMRCGLGNFRPQCIGSSDLYKKLAQSDFYYPETRWDHQVALSFLVKKEVTSILEFGCGSGQFLKSAARAASNVIGIDFNADAVDEARRHGLNCFTALDDVVGSFQAVVAFQTLEHLEKPGSSIRELIGRISSGGYLIIAVPNEDGPLGRIVTNPLNAPPHHATLWPKSALEYLAEAHGLTLELYAKEPINWTLYLTVLDQSMRMLPVSGRLIAKTLEKVFRLKAYVEAAVSFAERRVALDGHNHIAIYRKPTEGRR